MAVVALLLAGMMFLPALGMTLLLMAMGAGRTLPAIALPVLPLLSLASAYLAVRIVRIWRPDASRIRWRMIWLGTVAAPAAALLLGAVIQPSGDTFFYIVLGSSLVAAFAGASVRDTAFSWSFWPRRPEFTTLELSTAPPERGRSASVGTEDET